MSTDAELLKLAREAYSASTSYFDASIRNQIEANLRQFQGLHPRGSKYMADVNRSRSRLFRPKTRATIRKNEALAAEAFFSTTDVVSVGTEDDNDPHHQASAAIMQQILQHRLTKSIPWFQTLIGGYQDALSVGVVCSYQCWEYNAKKKIDKPAIKLIPIENVRFDPAASWIDPVNTSPYFIELVPMYVKDVKARMRTINPRTGEAKWKTVEDSKILAAVKAYGDTTRLQREQGRQDSKESATATTDFSIVWVHKNIVEIDGADVIYYTLGTEELLSDAVPLDDRYAHGHRPYVIGNCVIEAHKIYPSSLATLGKDVQAEINDLANLRIDNIRFALNKRYFVKRNKQVDIRSLVRGVAGSATLMEDPEKDVKTVEFNDVTGSSYQEQDRLNLDFDDITGTFNGASVQSNRKLNETVGGMELLDGSANQVSGYQLRTFVETWVEPVLRQLILLEQNYETDEVILAMAGKKADLLDKFGIDTVTDELLMQELTLTVNVGMGATNPTEQVKKFMQGMTSLKELVSDGTMMQIGLNVEEVITELFGKLGYRDGSRFFNADKAQDPMITQMQATIDQLTQKIQQKEDPELTKARIEHLQAQVTSLGVKDKQIDADTIAKMVSAMFSAMQAAEVVAAVPQVAPVADQIMIAAGAPDPNFPAAGDPGALGVEDVKNKRTGISFTPGGNTSPSLPAPAVAPADGLAAPSAAPVTPASGAEGMQKGIETQRADSAGGLANGGVVDEDQSGYVNTLYTAGELTGDPDLFDSYGASGKGIMSRFADGGMITGPGTGTSDSVPAQVAETGQPVAVSAGEFHIPAAVVAKVGIDYLKQLVAQFHTPTATDPQAAPEGDPMAVSQGDFIVPADVVEALGADYFQHLIEQFK